MDRVGLLRVVVLAPRIRLDLVLRSDLIVADLLPGLLAQTRSDTAGPPARGSPAGWCLSRVGGPELDPGRTLGAHAVLDGELLELRQRRDELPAPVYDDVVDAVAAVAGVAERWTARRGIQLGLLVAGTALLAAASSLGRLPATANPGRLSAVLMVTCLGVAAALGRAGGNRAIATVLAAAAMSFGAVAGLRVAPAAGEAVQIAWASGAITVVSLVALAARVGGRALFVGAVTVGGSGGATFLLAGACPGLPEQALAAGLLSGAAGLILGAPRLAVRLAGLPKPSVLASSAGDLSETADDGPVDADVRQRVAAASDYLTGVLGGLAAAVSGSAVFLSMIGDNWGRLVAGAGLALLLLRSRAFNQSWHVLAVLGPGVLGGLICVGVVTWSEPPDGPPWAVMAFLLTAGGAALLGVVAPCVRFAPATLRLVDALEAALVVAMLPLAGAAMGLYAAVRQL